MLKIKRCPLSEDTEDCPELWECFHPGLGVISFRGYGESPIVAYDDYVNEVLDYLKVSPDSRDEEDVKFVLNFCLGDYNA